MKKISPYLFLILLTFGCWGELLGSTNADCITLVCSDGAVFNIPLNSSRVITPQDVLEGGPYNFADLTLELKDNNGQVVANNTILYQQGTRTFSYIVTEQSTGNQCWGNLFAKSAVSGDVNAVCHLAIVLPLNPAGKAFLSPLTVNNGSENYQSLTLDRVEFNCADIGKQTEVTLTAKANSQTSTCKTKIIVKDFLSPVAVAKADVKVVLPASKTLKLTPAMIDGGSLDNCGNLTMSVSPEVIDCNSPNPLTVTLSVKDQYGNKAVAITKVTYSIQGASNVLVCNDLIELELSAFQTFLVTADLLLEGGPYKCFGSYTVKLDHNGVLIPNATVTAAHRGLILNYLVTDTETGNSCWGRISVKDDAACMQPFTICDTKCQDTPLGDCASGHTASDNIEWPCDLQMSACDLSTLVPTPDYLQLTGLFASYNVRPTIVNYNCASVVISYVDQVFTLPGQHKIERTWTVTNFLFPTVYTYKQTILINSVGSYICDTLPWNAPAGDCASGHTFTDAVEWPADITVNSPWITPSALASRPEVDFRNVQPQIVGSCPKVMLTTYSDQVIFDTSSTKVLRTWSILNTVSNVVSSYLQVIVVNSEHNGKTVCVSTIKGKPLQGVMVKDNVMTGADGCATLLPTSTGDVVPSKVDLARRGVDFVDAALLREHILGIRILNPYQRIAADVTNDGQISTLDLYYVLKMAAKQINAWPNSPVWRFVSKVHDLSKLNPYSSLPILPYSSLGFIAIKDINYTTEFVGIKMGDIDGTYIPTGEPNRAVATLDAKDVVLNKGEQYTARFSSDRQQNMVVFSAQFIIRNAALTLNSIESSVLPNFTMAENVVVEGDTISINWIVDNTDLR